ncbi:MAG TPA: uridine kinase [Polyangiaceae bacterium]|nr:uridine kinase [Polyangiaceae bacterium]
MATVVIGIAGGTGSGKTTVATKLIDALPAHGAALIQHDWYYKDRSHLPPAERKRINFDEPAALENDLLLSDLRELKDGRLARCPDYDFATHTRRSSRHEVTPKPIIIVEGILLFAVPELRDAFDLRLFVETDDDIRLLRRIRRDIEERGRDIASIESQYVSTVRPMHQQHVAPSRGYAHLIIPEGGENAPALDVIVGKLLYLLAN